MKTLVLRWLPGAGAISCLALVTGLALIPAWSSLTDSAARRDVCSANLTALYRASMAYAADNDGYFPFAQMTRPRPNVWLWWYDFVSPYTNNPQVFSCPSSEKAEEYGVYDDPEPLLPGLAFTPHIVSYGMGYWYSRDHDERAPYRPDDLQKPADTLLFADARGYLVSPNRGGWDVDARHDGQVNVILATGALVMTRPRYVESGAYTLHRVNDDTALHWQTIPE